MELEEIIKLEEVPEEYRNFKFLNRGMTTICFEKDNDNVLLFIRDPDKVSWLTKGIKIATIINEYKTENIHPIPGMDEYNINILLCEKLYPLSGENIQLAQRLFKKIQEYKTKHLFMCIRKQFDQLNEDINDIIENECEIITNLFEFLKNEFGIDYNRKTMIDISREQFKQDKNGNLVLLDPIVTKNVFELSKNYQKETNFKI